MARDSRRVTYRLIWSAIHSRRQIICTYRGFQRECSPHILGYRKDGREVVFVFQFAGESSSTLPRGGDWRCLYLTDVNTLLLRSGRWHTGARHSKTQVCVELVDVDVNVPETLTRRGPLNFGSPELSPPRIAGTTA